MASYEASALTLEEYAERVVAFAESGPEVARRAAVRRRINFLRDAWGPLLKASLENWTTPPVCEAVLGRNKDHLDISRNPAKNIWQDLAVTYQAAPKRSTPGNVAAGERYLELLSETDFDLFWSDVELLLVACNEILIWPDVVEIDGEKVIKHRYACGDVATVITLEEEPSETECVLVLDDYADLSGNQHRRYNLWTKRWHAQFERGEVQSDGKPGNLERTGYINPDLVPEDGDPARDDSAMNPYGRIPMVRVRLRDWRDCVWDVTSGEDLADLTLRGGEDRQFYRYLQKMGGFKQLAVSGLGLEAMPQQLLDPGSALKFEGQNVSTQVIDWQIDLSKRLDCQMADEVAAAASRGINPERYKKSASYQTGFGARLAERALAAWRVRLSTLLRRAEKRYYRAFCAVVAAHQIDAPDATATLEIEHAPIAYPEDPAQQLTVEQGELAMALESQVSLIQRRHPEWTEDQAKLALQANMETIAWVAEQKASRNVPNDPTVESRAAEQNGAAGPLARDGVPPAGPPPAHPNGDRSGQ
jgi:hypothetical protein